MSDRTERILRAAASVIVPEGIVLLVVVLLLQFQAIREPLTELAQFYPYVVFAIGAILAWRFGRSQIFFALLVLLLVDRTLAFTGSNGRTGGLYQVLAILLPLNLVVLARLKERGIFTTSGAIRAGALAVQAIIVLIVVRSRTVTDTLAAREDLPEQLFSWTNIGYLGLVVFAAAFVLLIVTQVLKPTAAGRGFIWALFAALIGLNTTGDVSTVYFATASLILVVAIIETSHSMAYRDGLTSLPSRRALDEALSRIGGSYTVAMVDVDEFKKLNDTYGHDTGDQVLRMIASKLNKVGAGRAFRYGGEEFAILFPRKPAEETLFFLEAVRREIEDTKFRLRGPNRPKQKGEEQRGKGRRAKRITVTVSIGVAEPSKQHWKPLEVIEAADQALYRAKQAGRNRIES